MKSIKLVISFFLASLFSFNGNSQTLSRQEIDSIQIKIFEFIQNHDQRTVKDSATSELIFVILETDKDGRIAGINLLSDEKNKGGTYQVLTKLVVTDFGGWKPENFRNKMIMVPVYSSGIQTKGTYKETYPDHFWPTSWSGSGFGYIVNKDQKHSVLLSGVMYSPNYKLPTPENKTGRFQMH